MVHWFPSPSGASIFLILSPTTRCSCSLKTTFAGETYFLLTHNNYSHKKTPKTQHLCGAWQNPLFLHYPLYSAYTHRHCSPLITCTLHNMRRCPIDFIFIMFVLPWNFSLVKYIFRYPYTFFFSKHWINNRF